MVDVLGRPLTGEEPPKSYRTTQRPGEEFLPLLDAVLAVEGVTAVKWYQYIPYFNDGDPCEFSLGEIAVQMAGEETSGEDVAYWTGEDTGYLSEYDMCEWSVSGNRTINPKYVDVHAALEKLTGQFSAFENFLQDSFGDHSVVTATVDGFHREYYDHD